MADTPDNKTPKKTGGEKIAEALDSKREAKGLPTSNFSRVRQQIEKAERLRQQTDTALSVPTSMAEIPKVLKARARDFGERLLLAPLGGIGDSIYWARRSDPGQKKQQFTNLFFRISASTVGGFGLVGTALANQIRSNQIFRDDPEIQLTKMQQQFQTVAGGFKTYDDNFKKLENEQKLQAQGIDKLASDVADKFTTIDRKFKMFEDRYQEQEKRVIQLSPRVLAVEKQASDTSAALTSLTTEFRKVMNVLTASSQNVTLLLSDAATRKDEIDELKYRVDELTKDGYAYKERIQLIDDMFVSTSAEYDKEFEDIKERLDKLEAKDKLTPSGPGSGSGPEGSGGGAGAAAGMLLGKLPMVKLGKGLAALGGAGIGLMALSRAAQGASLSNQQNTAGSNSGFDPKTWFEKLITGGKFRNRDIGEFPEDKKTTPQNVKQEPPKSTSSKEPGFLSSIFGAKKGKPIDAEVSLDRRDVEKEKSQFLQFGRLPKGFEFLPGNAGRLGNPGAVAATGAVPLTDIGGGSPGGEGGGVNRVSVASREALGYAAGNEPNRGAEGVFEPLMPSQGGAQFGSEIPKHMRHRMAEGSVTPEGKRVDRSRFDEELKRPEVRAAIAARAQIEVGTQAEPQKWLESVMNRASARGKTLMDTVNNSDGYYPEKDNRRFEAYKEHEPVLKRWDHLIDSVHKEGSNLARGATGNESGKVQSSGAPIVASGGGERYVLEKKDKDWRPSFVDVDPNAPKNTQQPTTQNKPSVERITPEDQKKRPNYMRGTITMEGTRYNYGTGAPRADGGEMQGGSVPYGTHDISSGLHYGKNPRFSGNSFRVKDMFDPKWGRDRSHILFHSARDLDKMYSAGCFAVSPREWPAFRKQMMEMMQKHGDLQVHVGKDGNATVFPKGKPPPEIAKDVPSNVVPKTAEQVAEQTLLDPSKDEKMRQQFAEQGVPARPVPVKPDTKVSDLKSDTNKVEATPTSLEDRGGEFTDQASFRDFIEPELNKMKTQDVQREDVPVESQVKDTPKGEVSASDIEPMSPEDKPKEYTPREFKPKETTSAPDTSGSPSGSSGGGGSEGRDAKSMRNNPEDRAPQAGDGGYGSFSRCFVIYEWR